MVSGKAGRGRKTPGPQSFMHLFDNLAKMIDFGSHVGAHWILKGVPKSTVFENNQKNEINEVQETGCKKHDFY